MLFEIFRGQEGNLVNVPCTNGYAYFCEDTCNFFIDVDDAPGSRLQLNAYAAKVLKNDLKEIDVDDIFLQDMVATVAQGGTGQGTLTVNALLIGNGEEPVKMVAFEQGSIPIGNTVDGATMLKGVGALFASTEGVPEFGVLPIALGGTGGATAAEARTNLDVYNKAETDAVAAKGTTEAYVTTLFANSWVEDGDKYKYVYSNTALMCGKNGNVPPIIACTDNFDEYSQLDILNSMATPNVGIEFYSETQPTNDIPIIIVDVK